MVKSKKSKKKGLFIFFGILGLIVLGTIIVFITQGTKPKEKTLEDYKIILESNEYSNCEIKIGGGVTFSKELYCFELIDGSSKIHYGVEEYKTEENIRLIDEYIDRVTNDPYYIPEYHDYQGLKINCIMISGDKKERLECFNVDNPNKLFIKVWLVPNALSRLEELIDLIGGLEEQ